MGRAKALDDFALRTKVYQGQKSCVFEAFDRNSGAHVALKVLKKRLLSPLDRVQLDREASIHGSLHHPHIARLHTVFEDDRAVYLVQEFVTGGDLYAALKTTGTFEENWVVKVVVRPLLNALSHIHAKGIIHRDIKAENVLLDSFGTVKLADFGLAIDMHEARPASRVGTWMYMAPEVHLCPFRSNIYPDADAATYEAAVDIWAVGILVYELLVGRPPFEVPRSETTYHDLMQEELIIPKGISPRAASFLRAALAKDPSQRPAATQLLKYRWIRPQASTSKHGLHAPHEDPDPVVPLGLCTLNAQAALSAPLSPQATSSQARDNRSSPEGAEEEDGAEGSAARDLHHDLQHGPQRGSKRDLQTLLHASKDLGQHAALGTTTPVTPPAHLTSTPPAPPSAGPCDVVAAPSLANGPSAGLVVGDRGGYAGVDLLGTSPPRQLQLSSSPSSLLLLPHMNSYSMLKRQPQPPAALDPGMHSFSRSNTYAGASLSTSSPSPAIGAVGAAGAETPDGACGLRHLKQRGPMSADDPPETIILPRICQGIREVREGDATRAPGGGLMGASSYGSPVKEGPDRPEPVAGLHGPSSQRLRVLERTPSIASGSLQRLGQLPLLPQAAVSGSSTHLGSSTTLHAEGPSMVAGTLVSSSAYLLHELGKPSRSFYSMERPSLLAPLAPGHGSGHACISFGDDATPQAQADCMVQLKVKDEEQMHQESRGGVPKRSKLRGMLAAGLARFRKL